MVFSIIYFNDKYYVYVICNIICCELKICVWNVPTKIYKIHHILTLDGWMAAVKAVFRCNSVLQYILPFSHAIHVRNGMLMPAALLYRTLYFVRGKLATIYRFVRTASQKQILSSYIETDAFSAFRTVNLQNRIEPLCCTRSIQASSK